MLATILLCPCPRKMAASSFNTAYPQGPPHLYCMAQISPTRRKLTCTLSLENSRLISSFPQYSIFPPETVSLKMTLSFLIIPLPTCDRHRAAKKACTPLRITVSLFTLTTGRFELPIRILPRVSWTISSHAALSSRRIFWTYIAQLWKWRPHALSKGLYVSTRTQRQITEDRKINV
jgi:hypothetical protein